MRMTTFTRTLLTGLLLAALSSTAVASPLSIRSDRSDNTFYFTYEATSGRLMEASSSARFVRKDPVSFLLYVSEAPEGADVGKRLRARFSFELNKPKVVRYRGTFTLEVKDSSGMVVYTDAVRRKVVLRPAAEGRQKEFSIGFDLPAGSYEARALFKSS